MKSKELDKLEWTLIIIAVLSFLIWKYGVYEPALHRHMNFTPYYRIISSEFVGKVSQQPYIKSIIAHNTFEIKEDVVTLLQNYCYGEYTSNIRFFGKKECSHSVITFEDNDGKELDYYFTRHVLKRMKYKFPPINPCLEPPKMKIYYLIADKTEVIGYTFDKKFAYNALRYFTNKKK